MRIFDQFRRGGFADPSTLQGAVLFATMFVFFAGLFGRSLRVAVERVLAHDKHARVGLMAVKFLAKLARYCVSWALPARCLPWCADALTAIALKCDLLEQAKKRFALEGIGPPLLQTAVLLKDGRSPE